MGDEGECQARRVTSTMMIDFACPHCGKTVSISDDAMGTKGKCPHCGGSFMIMMVEPRQDLELQEVLPKDKARLAYDPEAEKSPTFAEQVRSEAEAMAGIENVLDLHSAYQDIIPRHYDQCETDPAALHLTVQACTQQIELAPLVKRVLEHENDGEPLPPHVGFEILAEIRERQSRYDDVVSLCMEARKQGWSGAWEQQANRCKKTFVLRKAK